MFNVMNQNIRKRERKTPGERLIEEARAGSREDVGRAMDACRGYLLTIARDAIYGSLRTKEGPSDLVQETYLEAQRRFKDFHGSNEGDLIAWLRGILDHKINDLARRYLGTKKRRIDCEVPLTDRLGDNAAMSDLPPSELAIRRERREALRSALEHLPENYRCVINWRNGERCSFEEIGRRLGRSGEAARKLWVRAIDRLSVALREAGHIVPDEEP